MRKRQLVVVALMLGILDMTIVAADPVASAPVAKGEVGSIGSYAGGPVDVPVECGIDACGTISPDDTSTDGFGGQLHNVNGAGGTAIGDWTHRTAAGDVFFGTAATLTCVLSGGLAPGEGSPANLADFSGTGIWNGTPGYNFIVHAEDRDGGGSDVGLDFYAIDIFDSRWTPVYSGSGVTTGGNFETIDTTIAPPPLTCSAIEEPTPTGTACEDLRDHIRDVPRGGDRDAFRAWWVETRRLLRACAEERAAARRRR